MASLPEHMDRARHRRQPARPDTEFVVRITLLGSSEFVEFPASLTTVTAIEHVMEDAGTPIDWHTRSHSPRHGEPGLRSVPPIIGHIGPGEPT